MRKTVLFGAFLACQPALADDALTIAEAAQECWTENFNEEMVGLTAKADVKIEDGGAVEAYQVKKHQDDTPLGRLVSNSATRAILRCAPYDVPAGVYQFEMKYESPFEK